MELLVFRMDCRPYFQHRLTLEEQVKSMNRQLQSIIDARLTVEVKLPHQVNSIFYDSPAKTDPSKDKFIFFFIVNDN
jgi:hypothetical protein